MGLSLSGFGSIAGLGSLAGGLDQGFQNAQNIQLKNIQMQALKDSVGGGSTAAQMLSQLYGGALSSPAQPQSPLQGLMAKFGLGGSQPTVGSTPNSDPMSAGAPMPIGAPQPPAQAPQPPQQPPQAPPPQGQPSQPAPQPPQAAQPSVQPTAPQLGQPAPQPQPGPPTLDQVRALDLPGLIQAAKRVNPNMTPQQLMAALDRITPLMNMDALMRWRQVQAQLGGQRIAATERGQDIAHSDRSASLAERHTEFEGRQSAIADRFARSYALNLDKFAAAKDDKERKGIQKQSEDAIKDELAAVRAEIAADNTLDAKDKARLKAAAAKAADEANARVAEAAKAKAEEDAKPKPEATAPAARAPAIQADPAGPVKVKTPEDAAKLPPGTKYMTPDGEVYER